MDVVVVEPGPFATELFPNLVTPENADDRAATYSARVHEAFEGTVAALEGMFEDPEVPTDPALVVDRIVDLVAMEPGTRPFRSPVGVDLGVVARNAFVEPHDAAVLEGLGLADFATLAVRNGGANGQDDGRVTFVFDQTATGPGTFAGTFEASGAISDAGTTEDALDVSSAEGANPLVATFRRKVTGGMGTLVLTGDATVNLANPASAKIEGTWRVESGTGAYADHTGSGAITGTADFTLPQPRGILRYTGDLRAD